jgi:hypothetical protein
LPDYSEQEQLGYVLYVTVCVTNAFEKIIILLTGDLPQQKTSIYLLHKTSNKTETENIFRLEIMLSCFSEQVNWKSVFRYKE